MNTTFFPKRVTLFSLFIFLGITLVAQDPHLDFKEVSQRNNSTGMYVLGGWAIANLATGAVGWSRTSGSEMYFHQMNFFWNTVNMGIAGFSLYSTLSGGNELLDASAVLGEHRKIENLYLINGGLDIAYMGTGFILKHLANRGHKRADLMKGYGNSIILQGGFLFLFDGVMWAIQRNLRMDYLEQINLAVVPTMNGISLSLQF